MEPFLTGLDDYERQQVIADQLRDGAVIWHRQFEGINVTWLAYTIQLLERFDTDELRRSLRLSYYADAQQHAEQASEFVNAKYRLCKAILSVGACCKRTNGANEPEFVDAVTDLLVMRL